MRFSHIFRNNKNISIISEFTVYNKKKMSAWSCQPLKILLSLALTQIQMVTFQCKHIFIQDHKVIKYGFKMTLKSVGSADIQYFVVFTRVYFLSDNVGIHFVFYILLYHTSFWFVPRFSGITAKIIMKRLLSFHNQWWKCSMMKREKTLYI